MKKILCLILCSICLFSITGCKDRRKDDANSSSNAIIKDETQVFTKSSDYDNWKDFKNFATYVDGEQKSDKFSFKTPYDISQTINDLRTQMFAKDDNCFIFVLPINKYTDEAPIEFYTLFETKNDNILSILNKNIQDKGKDFEVYADNVETKHMQAKEMYKYDGYFVCAVDEKKVSYNLLGYAVETAHGGGVLFCIAEKVEGDNGISDEAVSLIEKVACSYSPTN